MVGFGGCTFCMGKCILSASHPPNPDFIWEPHSLAKKLIEKIWPPLQATSLSNSLTPEYGPDTSLGRKRAANR